MNAHCEDCIASLSKNLLMITWINNNLKLNNSFSKKQLKIKNSIKGSNYVCSMIMSLNLICIA